MDLFTASNSFSFILSRPADANTLRADSPFGINTAFDPEIPDLDARLKAMQQAGIKWGRQDFTWRRIETIKGQYHWADYDELVDKCRASGLLLLGNLTYNPPFYDMRTAEGVDAYLAFAAGRRRALRGQSRTLADLERAEPRLSGR
jgi:Beta-galactosidase